MTLILAAICKDGISICADTRYTETKKGGKRDYRDGFNKIYRVKQYPVAIYNHGINTFNGTEWRDLCKNFEKHNKNIHSFAEYCMAFRDFIHPFITKELKINVTVHRKFHKSSKC